MTATHVTEARTDGLSHTFDVTLDPDRVRRSVDEELKKFGKSIRLKGFRPGRAPLAELRRRFGAEVRERVVDRMAIAVTRELIAERHLTPARRPSIHIEEEDGEAVRFTLSLEVAPEVSLGELGGLELERLHPSDGDPELEALAEADLRRRLFDALMARYDFPVPRDMVASELKRICQGFEAEVGEAVDDEVRQELEPIAERRIRLAVLLTEIGRAHDIRVPRQEVEALVEAQAERDPEHHAEVIDYYLDHPTALAELQSPAFEDRVVAFLLERSRISDVELPPDELRAVLEAP